LSTKLATEEKQMRYEGQIFRPFSEANSYLLQATIGCSHNGCTFCGMYKKKKYRVRSMQEIKEDIQMAREYYGDLEKVFPAPLAPIKVTILPSATSKDKFFRAWIAP
jgi:radical SAM superfamily enzyme YgiQ (UPF0313 family)